MKKFVYGLVFGALSAYLYVTQGALGAATLDSLLTWRDGARASTSGYGGKGASPRR